MVFSQLQIVVAERDAGEFPLIAENRQKHLSDQKILQKYDWLENYIRLNELEKNTITQN